LQKVICISTDRKPHPPTPSPKIWRGGETAVYAHLPSPRFCGEGLGVRLAIVKRGIDG